MEKQYRVGIVGATGMVGQRFVTLLENHPWFKLTTLAASGRSAGKTYEDAVGPRWAMTSPMPESVKKMVVLDASHVEEVASQVDFIFCAVNMPKAEIKALEEAYAKAECPVVSNNSANRFTPDVPMVVPEINADHIEIIPAQRKRLGTKRGFIAVKSNCSLQSYVPALHPLMKDFGVNKALVCTYQAISGAGKTFDRMPEIIDNVIPYIGGEEEKSEREPLKLWGHIEGNEIVNAEKPTITAQCFRVPVSDGHTAAVFVSFDKKPTKEQMLEAWANFRGPAQELNLPSAPKQFLHYFEEATAIADYLRQSGVTQEEAAALLGRSPSALANKLRLLRLSPDCCRLLTEHDLTERHARALLRLEDEEERLNALHHIIRQHLNVAQTEQYIDKRLAQLQTTSPSGRRVFLLKDVRLFLNSLDRGLRLVREAGIGAESRREDTEDAILLTIRIPKNRRVG